MDASSYDELFKEFQFDCKAIDEDDDNDETARTLLTEERQQRFFDRGEGPEQQIDHGIELSLVFIKF